MTSTQLRRFWRTGWAFLLLGTFLILFAFTIATITWLEVRPFYESQTTVRVSENGFFPWAVYWVTNIFGYGIRQKLAADACLILAPLVLGILIPRMGLMLVVASTFAFLIGALHILKLALFGQVLAFGDYRLLPLLAAMLSQADYRSQVASWIPPQIPRYFLLVTAVAAVFWVIYRTLLSTRLRDNERRPFFLLVSTLSLSVAVLSSYTDIFGERQAWSFGFTCKQNGMFVCLFQNYAKYTRDDIATSLLPPGGRSREIATASDSVVTVPADGLPDHILLVVIESLWDPTQLPLTFEEDPIPFLRTLPPSGFSRNLVSSTYGGGSFNSHFEALTGIPISALPEDCVPSTEILNDPIYALPRLFKGLGFSSAAVYASDSVIYGARRAYASIGFDQLRFQDEFRGPVEMFNKKWVSDYTTYGNALDFVTARKRSFLFVSTVGSHSPYDFSGITDPHPRQFVKSGLSEKGLDEINAYAAALKEADNAFRWFTTKVSEVDPRAVLFVYGDHLPPLTGIFSELGYGTGPFDRQRVPFKIVGAARQSDDGDVRTRAVSTHFIAPLLLSALGISPGGVFGEAMRIMPLHPILTRSLSQPGNGEGKLGAAPDLVRYRALLGCTLLTPGSTVPSICTEQPGVSQQVAQQN